MIPILETESEESACTWQGLQYTFTCLLQDFQLSPATLARELERGKFLQDITVAHNKT